MLVCLWSCPCKTTVLPLIGITWAHIGWLMKLPIMITTIRNDTWNALTLAAHHEPKFAPLVVAPPSPISTHQTEYLLMCVHSMPPENMGMTLTPARPSSWSRWRETRCSPVELESPVLEVVGSPLDWASPLPFWFLIGGNALPLAAHLEKHEYFVQSYCSSSSNMIRIR